MFNFKKKEVIIKDYSDDAILAMFDCQRMNLKDIKDNLFSKQLLGKTIAFSVSGDKVTVCSPTNGIITVLFIDGHSFTIKANNGLEILVHLGIDTSKEKGRGFKVLKELGSFVKANEAIVEMDLRQLSKCDTTITLTIINNWDFKFNNNKEYKLGDSLI